MRLPRDLTGADSIKRAAKRVTVKCARHGSHVRVACDVPREHYVTVPLHDPLRVGTLAAILGDVAAVHGMERDALLERLFS